jgi:transposase
MSKHGLSAGNIAALLARLSELKQKAFARTGQSFQIIVIQEAGLDGFWIHRVLQSEGVESHVVDPASIAISRRRRRAKTDRVERRSPSARRIGLKSSWASKLTDELVAKKARDLDASDGA